MKIKKVITIGLASCILLSCIRANAKTLAESFSGGSNYKMVTYNATCDYYDYKKTTYAKTEGYNKKHYVRAYIGGSSNDASNAVADSGRKWSSTDVKATASTRTLVPGTALLFMKSYFPTGYSKYGK